MLVVMSQHVGFSQHLGAKKALQTTTKFSFVSMLSLEYADRTCITERFWDKKTLRTSHF